MYTAILRGFPTGYQGQPSEILAGLDEVFETRREARMAGYLKWKPLREKWEFVGRTIHVVSLDDPEWSYLSAYCKIPAMTAREDTDR